MLNNQNIKKLALIFSFASWFLLLVTGLVEHYQKAQEVAPDVPVPFFLKGLLLNCFILSLYLYNWVRTKEQETSDLHDLIWKIFLTALVCTLISGVLSIMSIVLETDSYLYNSLISAFFYYVDIGLIFLLLMSTLAKWKRMVLYERNRFAHLSWYGFEYALFATTAVHFFALAPFSVHFNIVIAFFVLWSLVLSVNLKWIPQLLFNQKLLSIFQLIIILFCLSYFFASISAYHNNNILLIDDISKNIFLSALFIFVSFYTLAALLVIIFNLPTSSVFERKTKELSVFQKLSDSIIEGENEDQIYKLLLESAMSSTNADAGWLEIHNTSNLWAVGIDKKMARSSKRYIFQVGYDGQHSKKISKPGAFTVNEDTVYSSILAIPIISGKENLGDLVLLKKLRNSFDNTMIKMVNTFVAQASVALHNFKLVSQAVENERYKGELEIAKNVQSRLLPVKLEANGTFELFARSEAATEVGGDYYDVYKVSETEHVVIIADVAGKGISAAFNMAQMKGIFQSLVRLNLSPKDFLIKANSALSACLERSAFITASYYLINTEKQIVTFARAGHCPTLVYRKDTDKVDFLESDGLGLGIVRNDTYSNFVKTSHFDYKKDDIMLLYTDGVTEAHSEQNRELYGFDRLKEHLKQHHDQALNEIYDTLVSDIFTFAKTTFIDDDFTVLIIKF
ncbi:GAF domain-containing SpoIIE family protein phosphatase [Flammeovirgaceae bacterium SG7u.111]|nr:GAF domain-containing SpoIIE family protein phosphatase [Flammeovirgaceae bacterium SG7u.132]WPO35774.1 GAF domain-containing SpoIIE family protein phosphatase [Flammeovirgaceae bacterium SG7u.111]